ncbi:MAG: helix-turn-helix transcriptional regulator [Xanthobacteraceae bacterium]|jgi:two-component system nitrate/nitrite response regulator NarL
MIGSIEIAVGDERSKALTHREQEVVVLVTQGLSNKEVARKLGLSEGTVKMHLHSIYRKLDVSGRCTLIADSLRDDKHL